MISHFELNSVLQKVWSASISPEIPTQYPGTSLDANSLLDWYEFWVTHSHQLPHSRTGVDFVELLIDVHCYSRRNEKRHVYAMADDACNALSGQSFPISLAETATTSTVAIRLREAVVRDLTREMKTDPKLPRQHLVVSFSARVEQCPLS
ncbi:hypothetical protein SH668x_000313 [Planctomicrobium sp. SH668]|uniref:hypothetical protein n=1 Tax=Planctomicrobium sp. SH668 TaxID=3448126 RepID=UPI003F5B63B5